MSESDTKQQSPAEEAHSDDVDEEMKRVEEEPPQNLEDWPGGKAKYRTFGGAESDSGYGEGPTEKLGPADLVHEPDGSVTIGGEKVDNPEDYKGEPIPGGPTDPNAPPDPGFEEESPSDQAESDSDEDDEDSDDGRSASDES